MQYLHTMIRSANLEKTLDFFINKVQSEHSFNSEIKSKYLIKINQQDFFINKIGLQEVKRYDNEQGKFTLVFLCASEDLDIANYNQAPMIEITYNWPDKDNKNEKLEVGRSFGHIAYRVKNIYQICEKLMKEGVPINRPPRDGYMAFVKSPDNISIELLQAGQPLEPVEPWKSMPNIGSW